MRRNPFEGNKPFAKRNSISIVSKSCHVSDGFRYGGVRGQEKPEAFVEMCYSGFPSIVSSPIEDTCMLPTLINS